MAKVSIVIPAFNEEAAIGPVLDAMQALLLDCEIIVVDDGSNDATARIARQHGARVIRHAVNRGYGRSMKDGIDAASSDIVVTSDADGTYPVDSIPILIAKFEEGFDMVVGARQGAAYRGSFFKMILRMILKTIVEFASGRRIPDVNSGFRVLRKSTAVPFFPDICDGFSFTTTLTLVFLLTNRAVEYVPVPYHSRVGTSKVRMLHDSLRTLQYITECIVRYNPLKLFLLLSIVTLLTGLIASVWYGFGAFFLSLLTSMIVFTIGLHTETMRRPRA